MRCEGATATAVVIKDAGDDPDVTNGAHLTATVALRNDGEVVLYGGEGVGVVTRAGLGLPVGQPAMNPVPRQMITEAVWGRIRRPRRRRDDQCARRRADGAQDHQPPAGH